MSLSQLFLMNFISFFFFSPFLFELTYTKTVGFW